MASRTSPAAPCSNGEPACALIDAEQEAQVRGMRFEQRQPPQVVRAVARHDAQPGIQQVVGLVEERAVVGRKHLHRLRPLAGPAPGGLRCAGRASSEHRPNTWPFTSISVSASPSCFTVAVADSSTSISSALCLGRDVVDERDALVEEVPAPRLNVAPHPVLAGCAAIRGRR